MQRIVLIEPAIEWNIKHLLYQSANNLSFKRNIVLRSYADYLAVVIQHNMMDLFSICDYGDPKVPVCSTAKKLKDAKYFMIKFPFPSLSSICHLVHFFL